MPSTIIPQGYVALRHIGSGSTASVDLCRHVGSGRELAVKTSLRPLDRAGCMRFLDEARIMRSLRHPHILPVHDIGIGSGGHAYIACEYAPGGNFHDVMRAHRLPAAQVAGIGVALADALAFAHHEGVLHRDIKPANVLIGSDGKPLLADFGIAAGVYEHRAAGYSLPWASPETLESGTGDESSDIYSLAATLFALLVGTSPFEFGYHPGTADELRQAILDRPVPRLSGLNVPAVLELTLAKGLARQSENRWYSADEFRSALASAQAETLRIAAAQTPTVQGSSVQGSSVQGSAVQGSAMQTQDAPAPHASQSPLPRCRRRQIHPGSARRFWIAVAIIGLVMALAATAIGLIASNADTHVTERPIVLEGPADSDLLQANTSEAHHVP